MAQNSINFSECIKKSHLIFFWDSPLLHFTTENVLWNSILKSSPVKNILDAKRWHVTKWFFMDDTRIKKKVQTNSSRTMKSPLKWCGKNAFRTSQKFLELYQPTNIEKYFKDNFKSIFCLVIFYLHLLTCVPHHNPSIK